MSRGLAQYCIKSLNCSNFTKATTEILLAISSHYWWPGWQDCTCFDLCHRFCWTTRTNVQRICAGGLQTGQQVCWCPGDVPTLTGHSAWPGFKERVTTWQRMTCHQRTVYEDPPADWWHFLAHILPLSTKLLSLDQHSLWLSRWPVVFGRCTLAVHQNIKRL